MFLTEGRKVSLSEAQNLKLYGGCVDVVIPSSAMQPLSPDTTLAV